jgi:hypothetical protein
MKLVGFNKLILAAARPLKSAPVRKWPPPAFLIITKRKAPDVQQHCGRLYHGGKWGLGYFVIL